MRDMVDDPGPFHEGELALQRATGGRAVGASNGRIIVDHVIPNAVGFIARQELAIAAPSPVATPVSPRPAATSSASTAPTRPQP